MSYPTRCIKMKIGLTGTHSSGKTTIAKALLEKYPNAETIGSIARDCPLPINQKATLDTMLWIQLERIKQEMLKTEKNKLLICERTTLDEYCYLQRWEETHFNNLTIKEREDYIGKKRIMATIAEEWLPSYDILFKIDRLDKLYMDNIRDNDIKFWTRIDRLIDIETNRLRLPEKQTAYKRISFDTKENRQKKIEDFIDLQAAKNKHFEEVLRKASEEPFGNGV